ncbi:pentatricopeptide repeat-containing protein At4g18975, chloroplastic isoform X5 [Ricinus communis]|uniref:pentatricopeptide repeat-containing protein At4g18975, chloroplastic isoform X5 n=1 Tax=Ricinus communis TaxID=3988 RepID=UPI00201A925F|nr:pentatricopeptide repeat-containing protein At4g18975, chloroplastic isoform X5 [Ricinus communis]
MALQRTASSSASSSQLLLNSASSRSIAKAQCSVLAYTNKFNSNNHFFVDFVGLYCKSKRRSRRIGVSSSSCDSNSSIQRNSFFRFVNSTVRSQSLPLPDLKPKVKCFPYAKYSHNQSRQQMSNPRDDKSRKPVKKAGKEEHHLWKKRDSARSGEKALSLVRIVAKWMLSKGQGTTMGTYDTLLLAFDMDNRVDEAASLWNMILHTHVRSISKRLFSRMISLYDHHNMPDGIIEIFADMEELGVRPDEDTVRRVARAFKELGQEEKQKLVLKRYMSRWKYIHFKGERVRVRRNIPN